MEFLLPSDTAIFSKSLLEKKTSIKEILLSLFFGENIRHFCPGDEHGQHINPSFVLLNAAIRP